MLRWPIFASLVTALGILLNSRNTATTSKPNVICTTTVLNDKNYSKHVLWTYLLLIIRASTKTRHFVGVVILNTYAVCDLNNLDAYTLHTVHEQDLVVARREITNYMRAIALVLYST